MSTVVVTVVAQAQQFPAGTETAGIKVSFWLVSQNKH